MKQLTEATPEEVEEAADILIRAANGVVDHNDKFKRACAWGSRVLASMSDDESSVDATLESMLERLGIKRNV